MVEHGLLVPYQWVKPGIEGFYCDEPKNKDERLNYHQDSEAKWYYKFNLHTFWELNWEDKSPIWKALNTLQAKLGDLDDISRLMRIEIGSLVKCQSSFPIGIDQLLDSIGRHELKRENIFTMGCWMELGERNNRVTFKSSLLHVVSIIDQYLNKKTKEDQLKENKDAEILKKFINRFYSWFPINDKLTEVQELLLQRLKFSIECNIDDNSWEDTYAKIFEKDTIGEELDKKIKKLIDIPDYTTKFYAGDGQGPEWIQNRNKIEDPQKKDIYTILVNIHLTAKCHHNFFRFIENSLYRIATLSLDPIPSRIHGSERERMGHKLFGYLLGLNYWLMNRPLELLLLDLGHIQLDFHPRDEIMRVFAYLGSEQNPKKEWLAGCLWYQLMFTMGLFEYKNLLKIANKNDLNLFGWMESLKKL